MSSTDNKDFAVDFSKAASKAGHAKSLADAIGMPDEVDKAFIERLILRFERKNPGVIRFVRDEARKEQELKAVETEFTHGRKRAAQLRKFGVSNQAAQGRVVFEIPAKLYESIELHYPTMFTEPKHFNWFKKNFRIMAVPKVL